MESKNKKIPAQADRTAPGGADNAAYDMTENTAFNAAGNTACDKAEHTASNTANNTTHDTAGHTVSSTTNNIAYDVAAHTASNTTNNAAYYAAGHTTSSTASNNAYDIDGFAPFRDMSTGADDNVSSDTAGAMAEPPSGKRHPGKPAAVLAGIAALSLLMGCLLSLADIPLALAAKENQEARLAGLYITAEPIEPAPPEIDVDDMGNITFREQEPTKIYGVINDPGDSSQSVVTFPVLEGFGIYLLSMQAEASWEPYNYYTKDALLTDCHFTTSDGEEHAEASLYVRADQRCHYYYNPVYQQDDGTLYLVPGSGISSDALSPGVQWSQSIAQSRTIRTQDTEETESYRFTVKIIAEEAPGERELLFLDAKNQVLRSISGEALEAMLEQESSMAKQENSLPEQAEALLEQEGTMLKVPAGTAYLILRQETEGKAESARTLFDYGTEYLEYKTLEENGYLLQHQLLLDWGSSQY